MQRWDLGQKGEVGPHSSESEGYVLRCICYLKLGIENCANHAQSGWHGQFTILSCRENSMAVIAKG